MAGDEIGDQLAALHERSFGWALSCCDHDRDDALDALHSAYEKVLSGRAEFGGRSSFVTWLFAVIKRTAAAQRRLKKLRSFVSLARAGVRRELSRNPAQFDNAVRDEERERLVRALAQLPGRQRDVLHLVFYQDLTIAEAAEVLGVHLGTARTHYERGKASLRRLLDPKGNPNG